MPARRTRSRQLGDTSAPRPCSRSRMASSGMARRLSRPWRSSTGGIAFALSIASNMLQRAPFAALAADNAGLLAMSFLALLLRQGFAHLVVFPEDRGDRLQSPDVVNRLRVADSASR